jgi:hypothetical protein
MSKSPTYIVGDLFYIGGGIMAKNLLHTYTRYSNAYIDESFIGRLRADLNASSIGKVRAKEE